MNAISAALAGFAQAAPPPPAPDALAAPAPVVVAPPGWTKAAGRGLARLAVEVNDTIIDRLGRVPKEPEEDTVDETADSLSATLAAWFPDVALRPWMGAVICLILLFVSQFAGSKKKPATKPATPAVPAAASSSTESPPSAEVTDLAPMGAADAA